MRPTNKILIFLILLLMLIPTIVYAQTSVGANVIINRINSGQNIYHENTRITGDLDFTNVNDTGLEDQNTYRSYINSSITFINCTFDGNLISYRKSGSRTYKTTFQRNVTFRNCTFRNLTNFNHAQFTGKTTFYNNNFQNDARFHGAQFLGIADFRNSSFQNDADFSNAQFIGNVSFKEARFSRNATFTDAQFIGKATFRNANFDSSYDFNGATMWGENVQLNDMMDDVFIGDDYNDDPQQLSGYGLIGEYFKDDDLTNPSFIRTDNEINFDWGYGKPDSSLPSDHFSIRWTGQVIPEYSEEYTFYVSSDDGVRLWINGQIIIDEWSVHGETQYSGKIWLSAGTKNDIQLDYFENDGKATVKLYWRSRRQSKEIIPTENLLTDKVDQIMVVDGDDDTSADSMDASEIIQMIDNNKSVYLEDKTILGDLDFTLIKNTKKRGSTYISYVERSITIRNCVIKGRLIASANKKKTVYEEGVSFYGTKIQDNTDFKEAEFEDFVDFTNVHFQNNADFAETEFQEKADFINVMFERDVSFSHARFDGNASFRGSVFNSDADFSWAHFSEDADFSNTTFKEKPDFFGTSFFGGKDFSGSTLNGNSFRP